MESVGLLGIDRGFTQQKSHPVLRWMRFLFIYPALTGSNLSVPKAKRQVQDYHLKV